MTLITDDRKNNLRVISITGGKGGVGKSTISVNTAIAYAKSGKRVLLFDADLGLANIDVLLGLQPKLTLHDYIKGTCELSDICITGPHGIKVIPAASGIQEMADLDTTKIAELVHSFSNLADDIDIMIVDMASGISNQVIDFTHAAQDILIVICNDPSSLMDGYAVIKILNKKYSRNRFGIVVNKCRSTYESYSVYEKFQETVSKFINVNLNYLGFIPEDDYILLSSRERKSVVDCYPNSISANSFYSLCRSISNWQNDSTLTGGIQFFLDRFINQMPLEGDLCKV